MYGSLRGAFLMGGKRMKVVLVAINSKYIHSNLAVYNLAAYAGKGPFDVAIREFTINQPEEKILMDLFEEDADIYCFSTYIWNREMVVRISRELKKVAPKRKLFYGGPEVSYDAEKFLEAHAFADLVMKGEGEETFRELLFAAADNRDFGNVDGITYRDGKDIKANPWRNVMDLTKVPFIYRDFVDTDLFRNKIIYYETSRGCPFRCSYCLSSVDKKLRFRDLERVKEELQFFLDRKVPQVKFVDRTFNCVKKHALEIWKYISAHDNGVTNFHFEISADLLDEEMLQVLKEMRKGLVQLEIGVQTTNPDTLRAIKRTAKTKRIRQNVSAIKSGGNIHQHLDLIAGLPFEDYQSFQNSFDEVFAMAPDQLQLGFLKVLAGSDMALNRETYGLVYSDMPPYEVLETKWLSYRDIIRLKGVENMVEVYYNSGQFTCAIRELSALYESPFRLFEDLAAFMKTRGVFEKKHSREARFAALYAFAVEMFPAQEKRFREKLACDFYLRENAKRRPEIFGGETVSKEILRAFYDREKEEHRFLPFYQNKSALYMRNVTHMEKIDGKYYLFIYHRRDPLSGNARMVEIPETYFKK